MIIIKHYRFFLQDNTFHIITRERHSCPNCNGPLRYRDFRHRTAIDANGDSHIYRLRRLKCLHCGAQHLELPDLFVPHKHYTKQAIELALSGPNSSCPADNSTISRWHREHDNLSPSGN